jgi:hypothetical protein
MASPLHHDQRCGGSACLRSVRPFQQPAGNDVSLDLGRTFEDVEDAGVTQKAAHWVLEGEAVTPVNL